LTSDGDEDKKKLLTADNISSSLIVVTVCGCCFYCGLFGSKTIKVDGKTVVTCWVQCRLLSCFPRLVTGRSRRLPVVPRERWMLMQLKG
jgi:hypothetical protein